MLRASAGSIVIRDVFEGLATSSPNLPPMFEPTSRPMCHLLVIDGIHVLLDCGWTLDFDGRYLNKLKDVLPLVDCVLLSSSEFFACGAVPVLRHLGLRQEAPILATIATTRLAVLTVTAQFLNRFPHTATFNVGNTTNTNQAPTSAPISFKLSIDDIYSSFTRLTEGPYGSVVNVTRIASESASIFASRTLGSSGADAGGNADLEVRSFCAGRLLGASGWRLQYQTDCVVYAPNLAVQSTDELPGVEIQSAPTIFITDAFPAMYDVHEKAEDIEHRLARQITSDLRRDGTVLIPVAGCTRGIETLLRVDKLLKRESLNYPLIFACSRSIEVLDRVRTLTEFFLPGVTSDEVLMLADVIAVRSADEALEKVGPKIVVADGFTLEDGAAGKILLQLLSEKKEGNSIAFVEKPPLDSLAGKLWLKAHQQSGNDAGTGLRLRLPHQPSTLPITAKIIKRQILTGEALERYYDEQERLRLEQEALEEKPEGAAAAPNIDEDDDAELFAFDEEESAAAPSKQPVKAAAAAGAAESGVSAKGIVHLPEHIKPIASRFPLFPPPDAEEQERTPYGLALKAWEIARMRSIVPVKEFVDSAPEAQNLMRSDDRAPADILEQHVTVPANVQSVVGVYAYNFEGFVDFESARVFLNEYFKEVRRLVLVRGSASDCETFLHFASKEMGFTAGPHIAALQLKATQQNKVVVAIPALENGAIGVELSTEVHCYTVRIDSTLASQVKPQLRRVRETHGGAEWELGWIHGRLLKEDHAQQSVPSPFGEELNSRRKRAREDSHAPLLIPTRQQGSTEGQEDSEKETKEEMALDEGSVFIGAVELQKLRLAQRAERRPQTVEAHLKAPMIIVGTSSYVRYADASDITIESVASPASFDVRQQVYRCFSHIL